MTVKEIIQEEYDKPENVRWQPCVICSSIPSCETNCLRYNVYVSQTTEKARKEDFMRFYETIEKENER